MECSPTIRFDEHLRGKKVLITGGAGFIGSNLAHRLVNCGAKVTVIDSMIPEYGGNLFNISEFRDRITLNISDVRDPFSMAVLIKDQDYLFNLAGQTSHQDSMTQPLTDLNINAAAQLSILEACRLHNPKIRVVFASTRQVYGRPDYLPVDEKHPIRPVDVNGINKIAGEMYHTLYHSVYGIKTSVLRLTNTYGPHMRVKDARQTFLGIWIRNVIEGKPILVFGDGEQLRDFNYVDDVVDALILSTKYEGACGRPMNLGGPERISLKDLAQLLIDCAETGKYELVPFPPERKAIDIGDYYGDYAEFSNAGRWQPSTSLRQGLTKALTFFRTNHAHYW